MKKQTFDIKICGLKTPEAIEAVLAHGATHIGFIFFEKSPRNISAEQAAILSEAVRGRAKIVAVTVNAEEVILDDIVSILKPDILQLHGNETPEQVQSIKQRYNLPVIKAFSIREKSDFDTVKLYQGIADRFLFDAKAPAGSELPGGNGVSFDWDLLKNTDGKLDDLGHYMLSGGLNTGNIAEALKKSHAMAIDISSGVESRPGEKDVELIKNFFQTVKAVTDGRL